MISAAIYAGEPPVGPAFNVFKVEDVRTVIAPPPAPDLSAQARNIRARARSHRSVINASFCASPNSAIDPLSSARYTQLPCAIGHSVHSPAGRETTAALCFGAGRCVCTGGLLCGIIGGDEEQAQSAVNKNKGKIRVCMPSLWPISIL